MFGNFNNRKHLPFAVDIGGSRVRMLQLARLDDCWRASAAGSETIDTDAAAGTPEWRDAVAAAMKALLVRGAFHGSHCAVGVPDTLVQYKNVRMPKMPADEMAQALVFEARDRMDLGEGDTIIQHVSAGEVMQGEERRQEMIAMAIEEDPMAMLLAALDTAGLTPVSIETTPTALTRCFSRFCEEGDETVRVFIDTGQSGTKVQIARGTQITFYKRVDIGSRELNEAVAKQLELSTDEAARLRKRQAGDAGETTAEDDKLFGSARRQNVDRAVFEAARPLLQELAKEIGLCLRYYAVTFRGKRPEHVVLSGGEACDTQFASILTEQLDLRIDAADPFDAIDTSGTELVNDQPGALADWSVAVGLALRQPYAAQGMKRGAA